MKVAALFAHPDDLDLWAGGTILRHLERGDRVTSVLFYQCGPGRLEEMRAARSFIPVADIVCATGEYEPIRGDATAALVADVPDVVLTHWNGDAHAEHQMAFAHAHMLCQLAKRHQRKTPLLLMSSTYFLRGVGSGFEPQIIVDITPVIDRKVQAIRCYKSQHPERLLADVISQNRIMGGRVGVEYAEGFIEYPLFGLTRSLLRCSLSDLTR